MTDEVDDGARPIRAIGERDIKFLAAGEKIDDIETAIRELIENSIDAQATNIEVRLSKFGIEAIEVEDNGTGIDAINFDKLGIRYHTSKIHDKNFHESLETFGFRGEALSCLFNLANVTIITKTKSAPTGTKLTYKKDGTLSRVAAARDTGTTVIVKNLFHSLPVRRRQLELSGKKQYDKVVKLLYEQALARPKIRWSLCKKHEVKKEREFTFGATTLEGCLIKIFGNKLMDSLLAIRQPFSSSGPKLPDDQLVKSQKMDAEESGTQCNTTEDFASSQTSIADESTGLAETDSMDIQIGPCDSYVQAQSKFYGRRLVKSKYSRERIQYSIHGYISKIGHGRNSSDCQYIFVNKKPCDIPKVARQINEIYRSYSDKQYPFYCLFISVQSFATDFNVPRKRAPILQEVSKLHDLIDECLEKLYSSSRPATQKSCPNAQIPFAPQATTTKTIETSSDDTDKPAESNQEPRTVADITPVDNTAAVNTTALDTPASTGVASPEVPFGLRLDDVADSIPDLYLVAPKRARKTLTPESKQQSRDSCTTNSLPGFQNGFSLYQEQLSGSTNGKGQSTPTRTLVPTGSPETRRIIKSAERHGKSSNTTRPIRPECKFKQDEIMQNDEIQVYISNLEDLGVALECDRIDRLPEQDTREFSFAIHPNFNNPAEDELKLNLNKSSFSDMRVLGQFNCGFILSKLNKHIFIIDQHASDERANYEEQLNICPMVKQRMASPQLLYLNLIQENAILNNLEAFRKHGFDFIVDASKSVGYRVILASTSICRETGRPEYLGKEDIEELVDVAIESPQHLENYILKKIKNLSASIACRKSVMVGDKLTEPQMSQIVKRMSNLMNPWVCAHNRPTIRHLMDTDWKVFDT